MWHGAVAPGAESLLRNDEKPQASGGSMAGLLPNRCRSKTAQEEPGPWGMEGHVWTPPPVQEECLDSCGAGSCAAMCGRPLRCKKNLWTAAARERVLPC